LLISPDDVSGYDLSVIDNTVVGYMGPKSQETENWDGVIEKQTICGTGCGTPPTTAQLLILEKIGATWSKNCTSKMTLLVSCLDGVAGTKKSKDAVNRGVPIVSIGKFYSRLQVLNTASGDAVS
jgi:hypothetical protein